MAKRPFEGNGKYMTVIKTNARKMSSFEVIDIISVMSILSKVNINKTCGVPKRYFEWNKEPLIYINSVYLLRVGSQVLKA